MFSKNDMITNMAFFIKFESLCVYSIENTASSQSYFHRKLFKSCYDSAQWSTYYPDPKIENILNGRHYLKKIVK